MTSRFIIHSRATPTRREGGDVCFLISIIRQTEVFAPSRQSMAEVFACQVEVLDGSTVAIDVNVSVAFYIF